MGKASLLHKLIDKIESKDQSPLVAQRTLWRIATGSLDESPRDVAHNLFDWFCEFSKSSLSPEDQAMMDIDPESLTDPDERKRVIRRQAKISKRAKAKNRTYTSKVTPLLVSAVESTLEDDDQVAAADRLAFAAACAPIFTDRQIVDFLERIEKTRSSLSPSGGLSSAQRAIQAVIDLGVWDEPVTAAEALWRATHAPLTTKTEAHIPGMIAVMNGRSSKDYKKLQPEFTKLVGKEPKEPFDLFDLKSRWWERVAARVHVAHKPKPDYNSAVSHISSCVDFLRPRLTDDQVFDGLAPLYAMREEIIKQGDFDMVSHGYIDEEWEGWTIQTVVSTEELKANGSYMGNCTYSNYKNDYKNGKGILFKITAAGGEVFNSDFRPNGPGGTWRLRECAGRRNAHVRAGDPVHKVNDWIKARLDGGGTGK